ncbi:uncharacterized protein B0T23DRAFT_24100 [Neurospora hispaniola]|uniref:Uncharacterized protein n=1 Tax=Neurospora hispaniola TaxID=588809 RepID=A0AAJ0IFZ7_9PEZI|nr:hypothetical protein B0T23DRAFT_24100 [Neurospora hispaniola]
MPLSPRSPWSSRSWHGKRWKTGRSGIDVRCSAPVWTFVPGGCSPWPGHGRAYCVSRHRIESVAMSLLIAYLACKATRRSGRCAAGFWFWFWFCQWCFTFFEPEVYSGRVVGCLPTITGTCVLPRLHTDDGRGCGGYLHLGGLIRQRFRFRLQ